MNYTFTASTTSDLPIGQIQDIVVNGSSAGFMAGLGIGLMSFFIVLLVWSIIWKALALWKSARRGEKVWFVVFLLINTAGILEIIYLYINREPKNPNPSSVGPTA